MTPTTTMTGNQIFQLIGTSTIRRNEKKNREREREREREERNEMK